jgi:formylglycine-generating enzyme required for sulfatase activity
VGFGHAAIYFEAEMMSRMRSKMRPTPCGLVLLVGLAAVLSPATPVAGAQESGKKLALLVGIDRYKAGSGFSTLPFPQRDVDALARLLVDSGYRPEHVRVLTMDKGAKNDPRFLPIRENILEEFRLLVGDRKPSDSLLIALVGHGLTRMVKVKAQNAGGNDVERSVGFFCPMNADIRDTKSLISLDDLYAKLDQSKAGVKVMLVDACRDNPTEGNTGAIPFAPVPVPASVAALFSCSDGEVAWEDNDLGGGHGVFFHYVIEGLKGDADANHDGKVSLLELTEYIQDKVPDFVSQRRGRRQMPVLLGRAGRVTLLDVRRKPPPSLITNSIGIKLKLIPACQFLMGSADNDKDAQDDEKPWHWVRINEPFYLGVTEVTRGQFRRFVDDAQYKTEAEKDGKGGWGWNAEKEKFEQDPKFTWLNPGFDQSDEHPVVNVSWNDAQAFISWLSRKEGKTYRLPTEAEWEYACRAGTKTKYVGGDDPETLAAFGNVADRTAKRKYPKSRTIAARDGYVYTAPVGQFRANAFGLYDMHGNVWEWCSDRYAADYYKWSPVDNPQGDAGTSFRVGRGGGWSYGPRDCRSANRDSRSPEFRGSGLGFRLARVQSGR